MPASLEPPNPGAPRSAYKLMRIDPFNEPNGPQKFYEIHCANEPVGRLTVRIQNDAAEVQNIFVSGGAGVMGATDLRQLMRQLMSDNPQIRSFVGARISGARFGGDVMRNDDTPVDIRVMGVRPGEPRS